MHAVQRDPGADAIKRIFGVIPKPVTGQQVNFAGAISVLPQASQPRRQKPALAAGYSGYPPVARLSDTPKWENNALHPQAGQAEQLGLRRMIGSGDAQAVLPVSSASCTRTPAALGGQRTAVLQAGDRLCQPPAAEQRGLVGRGPAQNKDIAADARFAQRDAFGQTGDGKRAHTLPAVGFGRPVLRRGRRRPL